MKIIIHLFCLGAILLILDSCTVTKRHFGGGYHVEWKKNWKESGHSVAEKSTIESDTLLAQVEPASKSDTEKSPSRKEVKATGSETISEKELEVLNEEPISEPTIQDQVVSQDGLNTEDEIVREEVRSMTTNDELPKNPEVKKKVEPLTWVAFAFLLAGIGFGLLPAALFSSVALPIVLFFLLFLIAFINAVSSALRIKRNPDKYKAKPFSWLVLFFTSLGFALALILVLLFIISGVVLL